MDHKIPRFHTNGHFLLVFAKNNVYIPTGLTTLYHCTSVCKSYNTLQKVGREFSYQFDIVQATCNIHKELHQLVVILFELLLHRVCILQPHFQHVLSNIRLRSYRSLKDTTYKTREWSIQRHH